MTLVVSGGHSHLVLVEDYQTFKVLGRTIDDAAGEAFDKISRVLGLGYPGGPAIDAAAQNGNPDAIAFPRVMLDKTRYDFSFIDKYGYPNTVGGISHMFNQAYWNYAKLISGVLRNGLPVEEVVHLVSSLELDSQTINNWRTGVERALKRYIPNGTKDSSGTECEKCGERNLVYQEGCLLCMSCGYSKCS